MLGLKKTATTLVYRGRKGGFEFATICPLERTKMLLSQ